MYKQIVKLGLVLAGLILFFIACRVSQTVANSDRPRRQNARFLVEQLQKRQLHYDWFVAKAKAKYEDKDNNVGFVVQLRQRRDSLIWLTAKKVSVEGARVRISPQKMEILDRQNNEYIQKPFSALASEFKIPLAFGELQEILVGNAIYLDKIDFKSSIDSNQYRLDGQYQQIHLSLWLNAQTYAIEKIDAVQGNRTITALLEDYQPVEGSTNVLPHTIDITATTPESGTVRLKLSYQKIDLTAPENVNFEIPEHYQIRN